MNKSNRTQMSHFQNFIPRTFLDNLSLKKNLVDGLYFYAPLVILNVEGHQNRILSYIHGFRENIHTVY